MPSISPLARGDRLGLILLTLLGVALRTYGNGHGLPWITEPDDEAVRIGLGLAHHITPLGALLESSRYPHLMLYLMWFFDWVCIDPATPIAEASAAAIQIGRSLSGCLAALAIVPTFLIGHFLGGRRVAWCAAAWLCFDLLSVQNGHLAKPHAPLLAFSTFGLWYALRHQATGRRLDLVVAAAFGCLSGALIHSGFVVFGGIATAALVAPSAHGTWRKLLGIGGILALAIVVAAGVGYPNALQTLLRVIQGEAVTAELMGPHNVDAMRSLGLSGFALPASTLRDYFPLIGPFGLIALVVFGAFRYHRCPAFLPLLATTALFFAVFGYRAVFASRFMLPIVPCILIAAAAALDTLCQLAPQRVRWIAFLGGALVLSGWTAATSVRLAYLYSRSDTRELAFAWIERNVAIEDTLATTPYIDMPLALDSDSLARHQQNVLATTSWTRIQLAQVRTGRDPLAARRRNVWFPFRDAWRIPPAERQRWLRDHHVRYGLSLFDNPVQRVTTEYNVFRPLGDVVFETAPGPKGFTGADLYAIPFPLFWTWIMERSGPEIEIVRMR